MVFGPVIGRALREVGAIRAGEKAPPELRTPDGIIQAALPRFGELCAEGRWAEAEALACRLRDYAVTSRTTLASCGNVSR